MTSKILILSFAFLFSFLRVVADAATYSIELQGDISQEACSETEQFLSGVPFSRGDTVRLILSSTTSDLQGVLALGRTLANFRDLYDLHCTAYIDQRCLGPLAILCFACQNVYVSSVVSWGALHSDPGEASMLDAEIRALIPQDPSLYADRAQLVKAFVGTSTDLPMVVTQHELFSRINIQQKFFDSDKDIICFRPQSMLDDRLDPGYVSSIFREHIHLLPKSWIGRIIVDDKRQGISEATWIYVKAAIDFYQQHKPACVVLELDTPGGEVFAAQKIANALQELDLQFHIPVVAYVNNWAISAGALIAYSCRYIVASPDACMGAASPVIQTADGMEAAPEKVHSALRADFANRASLFRRNDSVARAMVDPDIILVRRHGRIVSVTSEQEILRAGGTKDEVISPKGKLLTLTSEQMLEYGVASAVISSDIPKDFSHSSDQLLSSTPFRSLPVFSDQPHVRVSTFQTDAKTSTIAFLAGPAVASILFFIFVVCCYLEFSSPGITLPGLVGGMALFLLIVGSFAQEAIYWFEPLCIVAGIGLVVTELLFFPSLGFLLFVGGGLFLYGLVAILLPGLSSVRYEGEAFNAAGEYVLLRLSWLSGALLAALLTAWLIGRLPLKTYRRLGIILTTSSQPVDSRIPLHVGDEGCVVATLRPAGKIECQGKLYDAVSRGMFVDVGAKVRIVSIEGSRIFVDPL